MKAVNEVKPINVLARFIAAWIREHGEDAAPFDSFEALRAEPIEQKDVERWILNCNYTYYRLGDTLFGHDLIPAGGDEAVELFALLDTNIKSIRDSNPLNLRSKQPDAILGELGKDWPPYCKRSRNDISKLSPRLQELVRRLAPGNPGLAPVVQDFVRELAGEARFYRNLGGRTADAPIVKRCRDLLPIWCAKGINPLYTLLLWENEQAVSALANQLAQAFAANGYPSFDGGSKHDAYCGVVRAAQRLYLAELDEADGKDARQLSIERIAGLLDEGFFSLEHPSPVPGLPVWLPGKALLIWNTVICSIAGPREAIRPTGPIRTATTLEPAKPPTMVQSVYGEALLRRCLRSGVRELAGTVDLSAQEPEGTLPLSGDGEGRRLWRVIGGVFDERARVPDVLEPVSQDVPQHFLSTARIDDRGNQIEGIGDSRYHVLLSLVPDGSAWAIEARDLGSKNGTYITRQRDGRTHVFVLASRDGASADAWALRTGTDVDHVSVHDTVLLERGDAIQLCGSRFELL